jgi:hypothetical protein
VSEAANDTGTDRIAMVSKHARVHNEVWEAYFMKLVRACRDMPS